MKPRNFIEQSQSCTQLPLDLIEHDGRYFLECNGSQIDGSHLGFSNRQLVELVAKPFRPARQPRVVFLGLGFGHAVKAIREALPQLKASFVILPEARELPDWISSHLAEDPLDDERVFLQDSSPFAPLPIEFMGIQAVVADLDHLNALAPKDWTFSSPAFLSTLNERLKFGGLLGLVSNRPDPALEKELRKSGFEVISELVPLSEKSKKNRTLYLARKGSYQR
ncbi:hypothetical protein N9A86_05350 [Akkermansiaceae bacterium]|nr:hypothetical protein [Akkermansiaceae bacterium]MDB4544428.1 hypothetical protein [Akkermansiaceae bacterium]